MREIGDIIRKFEGERDRSHALATLVKAYGSSYRRPGARMLISSDGSATGSLSGGCLELEVIDKAREVIRRKKPAWIAFDTRRRFGCHGAIEILIEPVCHSFLSTLSNGYHQRRSMIVQTSFARGDTRCVSVIVDTPVTSSRDILVQRIDPVIQLLVVGDGPDNKAFRAFSETLGWQVVELENATQIEGPYDYWTAAIIKTHNYGRDFAALHALLPLGLKYIGLMGPRRRRDQLLGDMLDCGCEGVENLYAPAGLGLGGDSPEAIALAIVAEIQSVFAGGTAQPLRDRRAPIHEIADEPLPAIAI